MNDVVLKGDPKDLAIGISLKLIEQRTEFILTLREDGEMLSTAVEDSSKVAWTWRYNSTTCLIEWKSVQTDPNYPDPYYWEPFNEHYQSQYRKHLANQVVHD